ncbi:MAG: hypothetical protein GKR89_01315 [Candidatus Latescibacteria bacterium]|nr:hypothetical protein [Candidatus Latescibacterota bacterium]
MSVQLPPRPNLEQIKKQAKNLRNAYRQADPDALQRIKTHHPRLAQNPIETLASAAFSLQDAQLVLARELGYSSWPKLVEGIARPDLDAAPDVEPPVGGENLLTPNEMAAALDFLGLKVERFGYQAEAPHSIAVHFQHSLRGQRQKAQSLRLKIEQAGMHTLLLFIHDKGEKIEFAVQSGGQRAGLGIIPLEQAPTTLRSLLGVDQLPLGRPIPVWVRVSGDDIVQGFEERQQRAITSVDDIAADYDQAVVVLVEITPA